MDTYKMVGAPDAHEATWVIYATHPAPSGTYLVYARKDGSTRRTAVVLWGVIEDGIAVPITLSGVWDGVSDRNSFVLHPDGSCGKFEQDWATLEEAAEAVRHYDD